MQRRLLRLLKLASLEQSARRKKDIRDNIELGGLALKAGLRLADKAFILGAHRGGGDPASFFTTSDNDNHRQKLSGGDRKGVQ